MTPVQAPAITIIIDDLEQQARSGGLETNRLLAADASVQGLLLTVSSFPARRLIALAKTLEPQPMASMPGQSQGTTDSFQAQLALEVTMIHKARLPSALLLIEAIPGRPAATPRLKHKNNLDASINQEIVNVLQGSEAANALAGQYDASTFALLLGGISVGKTLILAREIFQEFRLRPLLKQLICTMGIAAAPAGCELAADPFLALAAAQIPQARLALPDRIHHAIYDSARLSCQVTAEERAVLFFRPKG